MKDGVLMIIHIYAKVSIKQTTPMDKEENPLASPILNINLTFAETAPTTSAKMPNKK